jgi:hypothetical protein
MQLLKVQLHVQQKHGVQSKNGGKTKFHRNGLLVTLGSNLQEGQN